MPTPIKVIELPYELKSVRVAEVLDGVYSPICKETGIPFEASVEIEYRPFGTGAGTWRYLELCSVREFLRDLAQEKELLLEGLAHETFEAIKVHANLDDWRTTIKVAVTIRTEVHGVAKAIAEL